jgi:thioredoxin-dependent peroxiredoxin
VTLRLGQAAPDFEQDTANGSLRFHSWLDDSWGLLFCHPRDGGPISAAELAAVALLRSKWDERNVKPVALSVETSDGAWRLAHRIEASQGQMPDFPLIADSDRRVAALYDMVDLETEPDVAARYAFVIDPAKRVRLILAYPADVGRNFEEILRVIGSLQAADARARRSAGAPAGPG